MWNRLRFIRFLQVSQIFQRRKSDTNKQDFENKLNLTCHAQSTPKTTGFLTKVFSTSGPNLVALAWTVDELSREQAPNGVNFDFEVKFDLEGQGQSPPKTIGILTKVFYTYGPNLVILAWTGDELSRGQTWWRTDWRTDGRTQATTIPEGQYWSRVIKRDEKQIQISDLFIGFGFCLIEDGNIQHPCRSASKWRHNERDGVSNQQSHDYLLKRLFRRRSKTTSKLRVTGLCEWNSTVTCESPPPRHTHT